MKWLLSKICSFEEVQTIIKTIITDEDQAFMSAFKSFITEINKNNPNHIIINHVICALHKKRNLIKKINKYGLSKLQKEIAIDYFNIISYHPNSNFVQITLNKLKMMSPKLTKYISKHVEPYFINFSRSYLTKVYCNGYNVTSPGESMNNLLKYSLNGSIKSLVQSRKEFDISLENHRINSQIKIMRLRLPNDCFFDSQFISKSLIIKILTQINIAKDIIIEETNEIPYTHIAYHRKHRDILYFLNSDTCICNQVTICWISMLTFN